jgi:hypothetical protein
MSGTRRDILISGLSTASIFAVSGTAGAETMKACRSVGAVEKVGYAGATAGGVCGHCSYFQSNADEAFATCPMFSRASRWQERSWCSAFDKKA